MPDIHFSTLNRANFKHTDGYDGVSDTDLGALVELCQEATKLLIDELQRRKSGLSKPLVQTARCKELLQIHRNAIIATERLDSEPAMLLQKAVAFANYDPARRPNLLESFYKDISRQCGQAMFLLCASGLSQRRIAELGKVGRVNIVQHLKNMKASYGHEILETLAIEHGVSLPDRRWLGIRQIS